MIVLTACFYSNRYFKKSLSLNKEANLDKFADTSLPYIYTWEVQIVKRRIYDSSKDEIIIGIGEYGKSSGKVHKDDISAVGYNWQQNDRRDTKSESYYCVHKMSGVCEQNTWYYICGRYIASMDFKAATEEWKDGDIIKLELDVPKQTLMFWRNGRKLGHGITDVVCGDGIKYECMAEKCQVNDYFNRNKPKTEVKVVSFNKYQAEYDPPQLE